MRKITLFVAAVAALVLIGIGTWRIGGRTSAPTSACDRPINSDDDGCERFAYCAV